MQPSLSLLKLLSVSSGLACLCRSSAVNRTIDDKNGDSVTGVTPSYIPESPQWIQGETCSFCDINPSFIDVDNVHDGTWHDATYLTTDSSSELVIAFNFTGTAVYIYNILVNQVLSSTGAATTSTNLTFHIDGENVGQFARAPDDTRNVIYNVPVYVNTSLEKKQHAMQIRAGGTTSSLVLFDYAQYTVEEEGPDPCTTPPSSSPGSPTDIPPQPQRTKSHVAAALGGVAVGIVVVAAILAFCAMRMRRHRRRGRIHQWHSMGPPPLSSGVLNIRGQYQPSGATLWTHAPPPSGSSYPTHIPIPHNSLSPHMQFFNATAFPLETTTYDKTALVMRIRTLEARMHALQLDRLGIQTGEQRDVSDHLQATETGEGAPNRIESVGNGEPTETGEGVRSGPDHGGGTARVGVGAATALSEMRTLIREMGVLRAELAMREQRLAGGAPPTYTEALNGMRAAGPGGKPVLGSRIRR